MKGVYDCEVIAHSEASPGVTRTLLRGCEIAREAKPGQFVNAQVSATTTDPLLRRPFSVHATYPDEGVFSLLYALVGRGTALMDKIAPGEKISVVGPLGRGFDLGDNPNARHILVAGGCGAAPLHFLCDALCAKWDCANIMVITGARTKNSVLCGAEFKSHGVEVEISTDDGSFGHHGLVTEVLQSHLSSSQSPLRVYSCGPHAMMREVARIALEAGVSSCQVSLENNMACGIGVCMGCVQKIKGPMPGDKSGNNWHRERVCKDGPVFNAEDIIWD